MENKRCKAVACLGGCALEIYLQHSSKKQPDEAASAFETFTDCPHKARLEQEYSSTLSASRAARAQVRLKKH